MDIFSVFTLLGGLAFFMFGMNIMGTNLEKVSGGRLESTLEKMTSNTFKGFFLGMAVTAVIQSSSATTVMVVGFVNSGIMKLSQAIGVIMGANVGTTVTAWILSLTGIQGDSFVMQMLKPANFSPLLAFIGLIMTMMPRAGKKKDIGTILLAFALLMTGMEIMSGAVRPLADMPQFQSILTAFENPVLGIAVGALFTAVIQSSSASVGVLQALSSTGTMTYGSCVPIIMGQNIGTCITALLSCIGAKKNAKRAAFVHLYFNLVGTVVIGAAFYLINAFVNFDFLEAFVGPADIAIVHTCFNLLTTALLLPSSRLLEKLAILTIKDKEEEDETPFLDERFLGTPGIAVEQSKNMSIKMAKLAQKSFLLAIDVLEEYDEKSAKHIIDYEDKLDQYEDILGSYLVKLSSRELSMQSSKEISKMLHCIGDFERIGDYALNVYEAAKEMKDKNISFSPNAKKELKVMGNALKEILDMAITAFINDDYDLADSVEPLEQVIDDLREALRMRHIKRLREGICTIELGFILSDILTSFERVSDHCSNIAVCLIEVEKESFETHEYLNDRKKEDEYFTEEYEKYKSKYSLKQIA